MQEICAVIAAGGLGTRLKDYEKNESTKVLIMLNGMSMISSQIRQISRWGVKRFIIITNSEFDNLIREDIDKNHPEKNISFTIQEEPLGIAHALLQVENLIEVGERILFVLGDNFFGENPISSIQEMNNDKSTVFLKIVDNPSEFGVATINAGNISKIVEKPKIPESNLAVLGIYLYNYECFKIIKNLSYSDRGELEITDLNNELILNNQLDYITYNSWWIDAGTKERIEELIELL